MKCTIYLLITFYLLSCNFQRPDTTGYQEEFKDREVRRVTDGQLTDFAIKKGKLIIDSLESELSIKLSSLSNSKDLPTSTFICDENLLLFKEFVETNYKFEVNRKSIYDSSKQEKEAEVIEAYEYNSQNKLPLEDNLQKIDDKQLLYTRPIILTNPQCIKCHGKKNQGHIKLLMFNQKDSTLFGVWSLVMSKKELIKRIKIKDLRANQSKDVFLKTN